MTSTEPSLADIRLMAMGTPLAIGLDYLLAQDHEARVKAVQKGVDLACNLLEQHKHKNQGLGEDKITLQICDNLYSMSFPAIHDAQIGGHCDIVIRGNNQFLWLAEAKVHDSYSWLDKGFKQLATRYSTGVMGQDNGEILIYCYTKDAQTMLKSWGSQLVERNPDVAITEPQCEKSLTFCSTHKHDASGLDFLIRHKAISLHWKPEDN